MRTLLKFILPAIFAVAAFGGVKSFEEIKDEPKGLAKDYYFYRLLTEGDYTKEQAQILSKDVFRRAGVLAKKLAEILPPKKVKSECDGVSAKNILDANVTCQKQRLRVPFMMKLKKETRQKLADKFKDSDPLLYRRLSSLNEKHPEDEFAKFNDTDAFLVYFNQSSHKDKFDKIFDANFINLLAAKKEFHVLVNDLIIDKKLAKFRQNFLAIKETELAGKDAFMLGINAVLLNSPKDAARFFTRAQAAFDRQDRKDNAVFWLYLLSKNTIYLDKLNQSRDVNIYTLYANELTGASPAANIVSPTPTKEKVEGYDIKDPFLWQKTFKMIKEMSAEDSANHSETFNTKETLGQYAYLMEKASGYKDSYFVMPFADELEDVNATRKALLYAIGRQESRFIPAVISTSYALGMMQFMPFLANHIGKKELAIPNFDQDDMFDPRLALKFADHHLNYLEKYLYHPLFVAYAYNGGIGFTKKMLQRGDLFNEGKYEPFLSMELVPFAESRDYGKKVLANYVIYLRLLRSSTSISTLFENLKTPSLTDKFRK
ncbi:lytic transglycosylase domain-containing protein [Campylobacter sp. Marseille-Q3452]|uniref:Lytic transglycosylase domain-containing protein n=1 Tax=Campylobacter massiliensis TaxID=2762557 RepID=A0A842J8S5_9BACT|nr:lytic transglycosylase domain-containing protein [Campylobacter massiliensis]MBC2882955.1 lytic transglycosylase domain-containing protein [Campylobacter massiliensis]